MCIIRHRSGILHHDHVFCLTFPGLIQDCEKIQALDSVLRQSFVIDAVIKNDSKLTFAGAVYFVRHFSAYSVKIFAFNYLYSILESRTAADRSDHWQK